MPQLKDVGRLKGKENKTHTYAAYETHFRLKETLTLTVKGWGRYFMQMAI